MIIHGVLKCEYCDYAYVQWVGQYIVTESIHDWVDLFWEVEKMEEEHRQKCPGLAQRMMEVMKR